MLPVAILFTLSAFTQTSPNVKFGKLSSDDLSKKSYTIDTGAAAVILYDIGSTNIKGNIKGWFSAEFKIYRRIHILNKNGYDHATVEIPLYANGEDEEKLDNLKASTYNLENGKVIETKLEKSSVFKQKVNKNLVIRKFTLPNVREGSIIEYEFQITSDFLFNLQPWSFQSNIPKLWSEYKVALPSFLTYTLISQGYQSFYISDRKDKEGSYLVDQKHEGPYGAMISDRLSINCGVSVFRWAMKDVPAMKEEAYTSTIGNYVARLEFQLAGYTAPLVEQKVMTTWSDLAARLLKRDDFGMQLQDAASWVPDLLPAVLKGATNETEKAKKIYTYVRDQFTCTDHSQLYPEQTLKTVYKKNSAGVAEINLFLTAMLRAAGLKADPVILSTKAHGFIYPQYPIIGRFNYVITLVKADGKDLFLDASYPQLGFGKLNYDCYNGPARVINEEAPAIKLESDQLTENEVVYINLTYDKNLGWMGKVSEARGYFGSLTTRQKIKEKGEEAFFTDLRKEYGSDAQVEHTEIDSLLTYEEPVTLHYDLKLGKGETDIIYFEPVLTEKYRHNPFKSADRQYPVEMPYKINETYVLDLTVPEGYIADEIPKPLKLKLDASGNGTFDYFINQTGNTISIRARLQINKTLFHPADYNTLREFFNQVMAKQNEQIVFKKKA